VVADESSALVTATYASFLKRVSAWITVAIIVAIVLNILGGLLSGSGGTVGRVVDGAMIDAVVLAMIWFLYGAGMESSSRQATLGKRVLGMVVTDMEGNRVTFNRATVRYLAKIISFFWMIGYIMVTFTRRQ
jgi:uncharacterized RDD family membrane protein YckC